MAGDIVVGQDGSDGSAGALIVACELAKELGSKLVIAYAYEVSKFGGEVQDLAAALHERGEKVTSDAAAKARESGLDTETVVQAGHIADTLAHLGEERGAAMIIVGSRGESPLKQFVLGSVAQKLLHLASTPVLVVPDSRG